MLNQSVAASECFSSFAEKILCATYPPPPGSAPGYQLAHQIKLKNTRNMMNQLLVQSGTNASVFLPLFVIASCNASFACSASKPPTARTAKNASATTTLIFSTNWITSVHKTDHNPDVVAYKRMKAAIPSVIRMA